MLLLQSFSPLLGVLPVTPSRYSSCTHDFILSVTLALGACMQQCNATDWSHSSASTPIAKLSLEKAHYLISCSLAKLKTVMLLQQGLQCKCLERLGVRPALEHVEASTHPGNACVGPLALHMVEQAPGHHGV